MHGILPPALEDSLSDFFYGGSSRATPVTVASATVTGVCLIHLSVVLLQMSRFLIRKLFAVDLARDSMEMLPLQDLCGSCGLTACKI
ncbi:hypothetical protein NC651_017599 [Populus alba x Populus x berolinensis]|nr:hypothetical protein NC651_017599 [Populus alba x Populus x berolinensis]